MEISEQHLAVKAKQYDEAYQRSLAVLSDLSKALKTLKENPKHLFFSSSTPSKGYTKSA